MLCLSESDILKLVEPIEIIKAIEDAMRLHESNQFHMPDRQHVEFQGNVLLLMPCFAKEKFSTKLVSVFPKNISKNKPVVMGTVILNDGTTGEPLALINGTILTALRTGAVGAVGIQQLTPNSIKNLGIIGAGIQGYQQALFTSYVRELSNIFVFDISRQNITKFINKLKTQRPGLEIHTANSVEELLDNSEAIITATGSYQPVLPNQKELLMGKHFIGIGSYRPDMREFPEALFKLLKRILIDTQHAQRESGDLVIPLKQKWIGKHQILTLGKWLANPQKIEPEESTLFKSVGMAVFDLITANLIYQKALVRKIGTKIKL